MQLDVGLNVRHGYNKYPVLGWTQVELPSTPDGYAEVLLCFFISVVSFQWSYSEKCIETIQKYKARYPKLFEVIEAEPRKCVECLDLWIALTCKGDLQHERTFRGFDC